MKISPILFIHGQLLGIKKIYMDDVSECITVKFLNMDMGTE